MKIENLVILAEIILIISLHAIMFWLSVSLLLSDFAVYYLSITYIRYRFDQVSHEIKTFIRLSRDKSDYNKLVKAIEQHYQITLMCMKNNQFVNLILLNKYYLFSPIIDMALYLAIYIDHFYVKLFAIFANFVLIIFLFLLSLTTSLLPKSAHSTYNHLNSIIARQKWIPRAKKMKIIGLIERLAGPEIAVYCYNFFPLTYYEFCLFIASISTNFFLLLSLID